MAFQQVRSNPGGEDSPRRSSQTDLLQRLQPVDLNDLRLRHLTKNIEQGLALIRDYEEALLYENDPARQMKYTRQITRLRDSITAYQKEYTELQEYTESQEGKLSDKRKPLEEEIDRHLAEVERTLNPLLEGQKTIQGNLDVLRAAILNHFTTTERAIIAPILEELDQEELTTCQSLLEAIPTGIFSPEEMQMSLAIVKQALDEMRQRAAVLPHLTPTNASYLAMLIARPPQQMEKKLAIILPVIPFLLSYQGEISLERSFALKETWKRLMSKI